MKKLFLIGLMVFGFNIESFAGDNDWVFKLVNEYNNIGRVPALQNFLDYKVCNGYNDVDVNGNIYFVDADSRIDLLKVTVFHLVNSTEDLGYSDSQTDNMYFEKQLVEMWVRPNDEIMSYHVAKRFRYNLRGEFIGDYATRNSVLTTKRSTVYYNLLTHVVMRIK